MRITVCVATKNRTHMLHQLLWSLIRQHYPDWDLLIVDDSDQPVRWEIEGVYPRLFNEMTRTGHDVRIVQGPRVNRIGAAYQVGLTNSTPDNKLFFRVDDDAWLEPDYLTKLSAAMHDDAVYAAGGLFLHPGSPIESLSEDDPRYRHGKIDHLSDNCNIQWYRHDNCSTIEVEHLTANILFHRDRLESIGGFEAKLYRQHRDETQVSWRLHVEGGKLLVVPDAIAWHLRGVTGGARGHSAEVYLEDHRRFMAQRRTMKPGIHLSLGHGIGDGIMATPMLHQLRRRHPDRNISVFAPWAEAVLRGNPDVDALATHPLDEQRTIRLEESVYNVASASSETSHLIDVYCNMFGLPTPEDRKPRLYLTDDELAKELPPTLRTGPYVVIAPWSSARTFDLFGPSGNKNWPLGNWSPVVAWAHEKGAKVVQFRASDDEPCVAGVDVDMVGLPLREVFRYIAAAALIISVDTMAHHVAAAFDVPTVVMWGRSMPRLFGYELPTVVNIKGECPGLPAPSTKEGRHGNASVSATRHRPCINNDQWSMDREPCPIPGHPCMSEITPEMVVNAAQSLWNLPAINQANNLMCSRAAQ